jgi:hypothetical protein
MPENFLFQQYNAEEEEEHLQGVELSPTARHVVQAPSVQGAFQAKLIPPHQMAARRNLMQSVNDALAQLATIQEFPPVSLKDAFNIKCLKDSLEEARHHSAHIN